MTMDKETKKKELEEKVKSLKARVKVWKNEIEEGLEMTLEAKKEFGIKPKKVTVRTRTEEL